MFQGLRDYASQVRVLALLLILCLVALLAATTYLYGRAKRELERELEARLHRATDGAIARLGGTSVGGDAAVSGLRTVIEDFGVSRVFLWGSAGSEAIVGPGPSVAPPAAVIAEARAGTSVITGYYGDWRQGYYRALLVPVAGTAGGPRPVLGVEVRGDYLGFLHRIRWLIIVAYTTGLALTLALSAVLIRSVLRPYARLASVVKDFHRAEGAAPADGSAEIDVVVSTFQRATETLREKEAELSRLYAAERTRAETLDRYQQAILGSISSGVISFKPDLTIAVFNETASRIFGIAPDEAIGRACHDVFGDDAGLITVAREALHQRRIFSRLELSVRRRDGAWRRVGLSSSLLKDAEGRLVGLALLLTDLTEVLQFREQAVMRDSLAVLGRMSAGIAHEFRNSLGVIVGYAKLLERNLPPADANRPYVQEIVAEINLLEATLKEFLAYARPMQLSRVPVGVRQLVLETAEGFRQAMEEGRVKLVSDLPQEEITIQGDPQALRQALGNVIRNALEAMPDGGELVLRARGPVAEWGERAGRRGTVAISVEDTGPGIPPEDLERIFTPFFTRKEDGTGLGLALVQKTVVALGGQVTAANRESGGACFTIRLPYQEHAAWDSREAAAS
jgi:two-component system nitrogen regulation sensor histidine kinase GlnL